MDSAYVQMGGVAGLGAAFLAGFLFSFTRVAFASITVVLTYFTRARALRVTVSFGLAFAAGMILTYVVLGGAWAQSLLSRQRGDSRTGFDLAGVVLDGLVENSFALVAILRKMRGDALERFLIGYAVYGWDLSALFAEVMDRTRCERLDRFGHV